jgi:hypothetical protein
MKKKKVFSKEEIKRLKSSTGSALAKPSYIYDTHLEDLITKTEITRKEINTDALINLIGDIQLNIMDAQQHIENLNLQVEHLLEVNKDLAQCLQRGDDINENILDHFDDTSEFENLTIKKVTEENQDEITGCVVPVSNGEEHIASNRIDVKESTLNVKPADIVKGKRNW